MAKKKSNKLLFILIGAVVILVIFAAIGKKAGWIGQQKEIEVQLAKASLKTIVEKVSASGTVQPVTEVKLSPDVSGEIIELWIEEGDSVTQGQELLKLRPDNYVSMVERMRATLNQMKANLADARARKARAQAQFDRSSYDFVRSQQLMEENVISEADYQLAEANFKVAKNDVESAEQNELAAKYNVQSSEASLREALENLRRTTIHAPVNGTISKLAVEKGERVVGTEMMTGTELLRIADLNKMEVRVDVNENDIIRVSVGDTAIIDVDSYTYTGKKFKGVVTAIANTANDKVSQDAVTEFEVKVKILNESYRDLQEQGTKYPFRPGMTASVDIVTDIRESVLSVPLASVTTRNPDSENQSGEEGNEEEEERNENSSSLTGLGEDVEVVFVNENGIAKLMKVKTGISDYDNIEILEGLES
ncbi:MAG: efflux RND transporter periplasmic adaptor subunit, partial [Cyclobacteriaceae bacterium]|nr:efflux RND transporter periplasmic adaptor subunit [Cyclobacteriaceae bacterium]